MKPFLLFVFCLLGVGMAAQVQPASQGGKPRTAAADTCRLDTFAASLGVSIPAEWEEYATKMVNAFSVFARGTAQRLIAEDLRAVEPQHRTEYTLMALEIMWNLYEGTEEDNFSFASYAKYMAELEILGVKFKNNMSAYIAKMKEERAREDEEIARVDEEIARVDEEIARVDEEIARVDEEIARVDEEIAKMKEENMKILAENEQMILDLYKGNKNNLDWIKQDTKFVKLIENIGEGFKRDKYECSSMTITFFKALGISTKGLSVKQTR